MASRSAPAILSAPVIDVGRSRRLRRILRVLWLAERCGQPTMFTRYVTEGVMGPPLAP